MKFCNRADSQASLSLPLSLLSFDSSLLQVYLLNDPKQDFHVSRELNASSIFQRYAVLNFKVCPRFAAQIL